MKNKYMFGLLACAAVSAVAFNAYANTTNDWFGAAASGTTLNLTTAVTNGAAVTVADSKITIDNDYSTLLAVGPQTAEPPLNDGLVTITSTAVLTPCASTDLPTDISAAQVGFAVAYNGTATNYYYYTASDEAWVNTEDAVATPESATSFTIVLDYRTKYATFKVGDSTVAGPVTFTSSATKLTDVAAFGSGSISSIAATYEVGVVSYDSKLYGSVADAKTAGGSASNISYINSSGTAVSATASNGMSAAVCVAVGLDPADESAVLRAVPVATDNDADNITLQLATTAESGVTYTVKNASGTEVASTNDGTAIKIPTNTGVYTITPSL